MQIPFGRDWEYPAKGCKYRPKAPDGFFIFIYFFNKKEKKRNMKKIIALLIAVLMVCTMAVGCSNSKDDQTTTPPTVSDENVTTEPSVDNTEDTTDDATEGEGDAELSATETILNAMITAQPMQFPTMVMPIDMTDEFALEAYTGLKSDEHVVEASFCEAAMGSQAFSLVLVKVDDAANAESIANAIYENVNPRKWICVEADDMMVVATGDLVLLAMMDSEYAADATAQSTVDLFATQCGELSVTLGGN